METISSYEYSLMAKHCYGDGGSISADWEVYDVVPIIALNKDMPPDRIRFTLAHEVGHIIMHKIISPTSDDEATSFASEFLVPSNEINFPPGGLKLSDFADLKRYWKVSILFNASRVLLRFGLPVIRTQTVFGLIEFTC